MKLTIIMPVFNEHKTILQIIEKVRMVPYDKEIIVVDDCSTDGTRSLLENESRAGKEIKVFFHEKNMGKGAAIKTAYGHARGDLVIVQDADLEYSPDDYGKLIDVFEKEPNVGAVYGSRFLNKKNTTPFWHLCINKTISIFANIIYGSSLSDWETCYKMFRLDIIKSLKLESNRFDIEIETTAKLLKRKVKITEVPISYKGRWYHEGKKIAAKDGIDAIFTIIKYKFFS